MKTTRRTTINVNRPDEPRILTVGALRELIDRMPDGAPVFPSLEETDVPDDFPRVALLGFKVLRQTAESPLGLAVLLGVEEEEEEDDAESAPIPPPCWQDPDNFVD